MFLSMVNYMCSYFSNIFGKHMPKLNEAIIFKLFTEIAFKNSFTIMEQSLDLFEINKNCSVLDDLYIIILKTRHTVSKTMFNVFVQYTQYMYSWRHKNVDIGFKIARQPNFL